MYYGCCMTIKEENFLITLIKILIELWHLSIKKSNRYQSQSLKILQKISLNILTDTTKNLYKMFDWVNARYI
ncbi:hypothetical protein BpHYR1_026333 [Brachionus plicatilis]|uniref:Uncharacterized protein n=1 Tax=Brachionus plicatilis TaxID=10195 RepID=A0A3M7QIN9_BRAPC|nr:hypothetical protein BpHYR1_026333 [Brachionus plicatilis]